MLYALWDESIVVTLNPNVPSSAIEMEDYMGKEQTVRRMPNTTDTLYNPFLYAGHAFTGWNTKADGSGTSHEESEFTFTENMTLYAQWTEYKVLSEGNIGGEIFIVGRKRVTLNYLDDTLILDGVVYRFHISTGDLCSLRGANIQGAGTYIPDGSPLRNAAKYEVVYGTPKTDSSTFYISDIKNPNLRMRYSKNVYASNDDVKAKVTWAHGGAELFPTLKGSDLEDIFQNIESTSKVGTGKKATAWIFTNKSTDTNFFSESPEKEPSITVWDFCKHANDEKINGCSDWYVPSYRELSVLSQCYFDNIWKVLIYGANSYVDAEDCSVYSSSINSTGGNPWIWGLNGKSGDTGMSLKNEGSTYGGSDKYAVVLIRSI